VVGGVGVYMGMVHEIVCDVTAEQRNMKLRRECKNGSGERLG
jgi:hypothetical protein